MGEELSTGFVNAIMIIVCVALEICMLVIINDRYVEVNKADRIVEYSTLSNIQTNLENSGYTVEGIDGGKVFVEVNGRILEYEVN